MSGEGANGVEDIVRRNVAALRAKANLTQQALADEMHLRGVSWTRETVAQVETTSRRITLTEAIAVAACLDVPLARLTATGATTVVVGESRWTTAYLGAAIAGTAGDMFPAESYAVPDRGIHDRPVEAWDEPPVTPRSPAPDGSPMELERRRRSRDRRLVDPTEVGPAPDTRSPEPTSDAPQKAAERIERRLRLRVTASDVDSTAQQLWSRSLEAAWEATRLNIILANKGYGDSDVTRWWNFTRHRELGDQTIAEAWRDGRYTAVSRLIQSLPDQQGRAGDA